jgi:hypothetical protein
MCFRGGIRITRSLGPTMTARGQSIGISIGMLDKLVRTTLGLKRGAPLKSGAWGGHPTFHPQTPPVMCLYFLYNFVYTVSHSKGAWTPTESSRVQSTPVRLRVTVSAHWPSRVQSSPVRLRVTVSAHWPSRVQSSPVRLRVTVSAHWPSRVQSSPVRLRVTVSAHWPSQVQSSSREYQWVFTPVNISRMNRNFMAFLEWTTSNSTVCHSWWERNSENKTPTTGGRLHRKKYLQVWGRC